MLLKINKLIESWIGMNFAIILTISMRKEVGSQKRHKKISQWPGQASYSRLRTQRMRSSGGMPEEISKS
jgi:hypothetical protein